MRPYNDPHCLLNFLELFCWFSQSLSLPLWRIPSTMDVSDYAVTCHDGLKLLCRRTVSASFYQRRTATYSSHAVSKPSPALNQNKQWSICYSQLLSKRQKPLGYIYNKWGILKGSWYWWWIRGMYEHVVLDSAFNLYRAFKGRCITNQRG